MQIDPVIDYNKHYIRRIWYRCVKKVLDIIFGIIGSILCIPILLFAKISYMCHGDFHRVLFTQKRIGKHGKEITIFKIRTMIPNADEKLKELMKKDKKLSNEYKKYKKLKNDPRITKVGKMLRVLSFDEFPQFFNLLIGNMSIVGPRPYLPREKKDMGKYYDTIIKTKPGITGYWQVNGRNDTDFEYRLILDEYYSLHKTITMDIKIIIKTIFQIAFRRGK